MRRWRAWPSWAEAAKGGWVFALLARRDFLLLWAAGLVSNTGDWVLLVALPITVYQLTHSALATSGTLASLLLPTILLGSVAGVFVDRWDRRRVMVRTNLALGLGLLPLLLVRSAGDLWLVYVVSLGQATLSAFFQPAQSAALPLLVGEGELVAANAARSFSSNGARLVGPALGGLVASAAGLTGVTVIDALSFLAAAACIAFIRLPPRARPIPGAVAASAWGRMWGEWGDGMRVIRRNPVLGRLVLAMAATGLGEGVMGVMFVIWIRTVIHGGALQLGWLMSAQAVGGLLGGVVVGWLAARITPPVLVGVGSAIFALLDIALFSYPVFYHALWPGLGLIALVGLPAAAVGAGMMAWMQDATPDETRGRVFGAVGTGTAAMMLAGTAIAGLSGNQIGPVLSLNLFQGGSYLVVSALILSLVLPVGWRAVGRPAAPAPE